MSKRTHTIAVIAAIIIGGLSGFWFGGMDTETPMPVGPPVQSDGQLVVFQKPRKIGIPELAQSDGTAFEQGELAGKWSLMFYGYTHCPDICPMTLSTVAEAKKQVSAFPQVVFVSVDPKRDSVKLVGDYVTYFDKDFIGVTGEEAMLQAMARQMSVISSILPSDNPDEYLVDHSASLLLLNPDVQLTAMIRPPHTIESINTAIAKVVPQQALN